MNLLKSEVGYRCSFQAIFQSSFEKDFKACVSNKYQPLVGNFLFFFVLKMCACFSQILQQSQRYNCSYNSEKHLVEKSIRVHLFII